MITSPVLLRARAAGPSLRARENRDRRREIWILRAVSCPVISFAYWNTPRAMIESTTPRIASETLDMGSPWNTRATTYPDIARRLTPDAAVSRPKITPTSSRNLNPLVKPHRRTLKYIA